MPYKTKIRTILHINKQNGNKISEHSELFLYINKQNGNETSGHKLIWCNCVFKTKQNKRSLVALGNVLVKVSKKPQALRSMRTSTSRPLILVPFMILHALSALSGQSNLTVPQPFDLPFSILISANCTWPAANDNEQITFHNYHLQNYDGRHGLTTWSQGVQTQWNKSGWKRTTMAELLLQLLPCEVVGQLQHKSKTHLKKGNQKHEPTEVNHIAWTKL